MKFFIDIIVGARPNFIKAVAVIKALDSINRKSFQIDYRLVHTGQHYDNSMSGSFFEQLKIRKPDFNLQVGSGTQASQTGEIMVKYENLLTSRAPQMCMVFGDVTSTMACAITAKKCLIPVSHVEAGIRSGDMSMPEEINRIVTDSVSDYFFTTSEYATNNLLNSGIEKEKVFFVGNTMIDTLLDNQRKFVPPKLWIDYNLSAKEFIVLTLHRPSNVDQESTLKGKIFAIAAGVKNLKVIFPVHPRTAKIVNSFKDLPRNIILSDPLPYFEFNYLVNNSKAVVTDSGGITEETTVMGVPCITLRDSTERPETVSVGTNELVGSKSSNLKKYLDLLLNGNWKHGSIPELWDGKTGPRIITHLTQILRQRN